MNLAQLAMKLKKLSPADADAILKEVQLRVESREKLIGLQAEREKTAQRLVALDAEIARLEGARRGRGKRRGATRDRSQPTLVQRAGKVLSRTPKGLRISHLAKRILAAGHKTQSEFRTFVTAVYLAIKRDRRFQKIDKGIYALRPNAKIAPHVPASK